MSRYQRFRKWCEKHPWRTFAIAILLLLGLLSINGVVDFAIGTLSGLFAIFAFLVIGIAAFFWLFPTASRLLAKIFHRGGQEYTIMWHFHRQDKKLAERRGRRP